MWTSLYALFSLTWVIYYVFIDVALRFYLNKLQLSLARQIIRESAIFEHHCRFSRSRSHFHFSDRFKIILQDELRQKQGVQTYFQRPMYFIFENQGSIPIKVPGVYIM